MRLLLLALLWPLAALAEPVRLDGDFVQGGLVVGRAPPGAAVTLDGTAVRLAPDGTFVIGFHRDAAPDAVLSVALPDGAIETRPLAVAARDYRVQRIDGLPPKKVTPPADVIARIRAEAAEVRAARGIDTDAPWFLTGWIWPAAGRITGVYGSQRILNGQPRAPHYGVDIAAPVGTPVVAPADGQVALAHPDMYLSGGTLVIDHGHGVSSTFIHLAEITVAEGARVRRGDTVATVGATGRATGAHLDWRINWFAARLDPALLVPPMGE